MTDDNITAKSLRSFVTEAIESFLYKENFPTSEIFPNGLLEAIDALSSYHEEGQELFPEIVLTTDIDATLKTLPSKTVAIASAELDISGFKEAIKLCAPLAIEGWVIFIEVKDSKLNFGVCTAELSETSPSLYRQLFGDTLKTEVSNTAIAYVRNIGLKTVQLTGLTTAVNVSFSLKDVNELKEEKLTELCNWICKDSQEDIIKIAASFFEKLIGEANKVGHGTLIGVIDEEMADTVREGLEGTYMNNPIDLIELMSNSATEDSRSASTNLRQYMALVRSMINSDGITVFTTTGKVVGYHVFVTSDNVDSEQEEDSTKVIGGARTRAFEMMKRVGFFKCCFFKSQDGNEKLWNVNEQ